MPFDSSSISPNKRKFRRGGGSFEATLGHSLYAVCHEMRLFLDVSSRDALGLYR